jgi:hypothetical protein
MLIRRIPLSNRPLTALRTSSSSASALIPVMLARGTSTSTTVAASSAVVYRSSSWPALTSSPSRGPVFCASTFEVIVDDQRISATPSRRSRRVAAPTRSRAASSTCMNAMVTSCGVVSTLTENTWPSPLTSPSVMVPPVSMSMFNTCASPS